MCARLDRFHVRAVPVGGGDARDRMLADHLLRQRAQSAAEETAPVAAPFTTAYFLRLLTRTGDAIHTLLLLD